MRKLLFILTALTIVLGLFTLVYKGSKESEKNLIDPFDYVNISFAGTEGKNAEVKIEKKNVEGELHDFFEKGKFILEKTQYLYNDDSITVRFKYDRDKANDMRIKIASTKKEYSVSGLKKISEYDLLNEKDKEYVESNQISTLTQESFSQEKDNGNVKYFEYAEDAQEYAEENEMKDYLVMPVTVDGEKKFYILHDD